MAGLPWLKVYTDLPRDPRSLVLGDMLGDLRAWTYVVQFRMYLADNAPSGRLSGLYAEVAFERCAGWTGERGRLFKAMRDAGFVRAGPARDGEGTEIEDVDWAAQQGAHVAKVERDAKKPRGNAPNVVSPSRDISGTDAGPAPTPRGESRELRVESREERKDLPPSAVAAAGNGQGELLPDVQPTPPTTSGPPAQETPPNRRKRPATPRKARGGGNAPADAPQAEPAPFKAACDMLTRVYSEVRKADYGFGLDAPRNGRAVRELLWGAGAKAGEEHGDPLVPLEEIERRWRIGLARVFPPKVNAIWDLRGNWAACAQPEEPFSRPQPVLDVRRGGVRAELMDHTKPQEPF